MKYLNFRAKNPDFDSNLLENQIENLLDYIILTQNSNILNIFEDEKNTLGKFWSTLNFTDKKNEPSHVYFWNQLGKGNLWYFMSLSHIFPIAWFNAILLKVVGYVYESGFCFQLILKKKLLYLCGHFFKTFKVQS